MNQKFHVRAHHKPGRKADVELASFPPGFMPTMPSSNPLTFPHRRPDGRAAASSIRACSREAVCHRPGAEPTECTSTKSPAGLRVVALTDAKRSTYFSLDTAWRSSARHSPPLPDITPAKTTHGIPSCRVHHPDASRIAINSMSNSRSALGGISAPAPASTVVELSRNRQSALAPYLHAEVIPDPSPWITIPGADGHSERFAPNITVELFAVTFQPTRVEDFDSATVLDLSALADFAVLDPYFRKNDHAYQLDFKDKIGVRGDSDPRAASRNLQPRQG